jgi:virginiamycin B lyase
MEFPAAADANAPFAQGLIERMPDGNMWFGEGASIARIEVKAPNGVTKFATTPPGVSNDVAAGPDGDYWFTEIIGDKIGFVSPRPPYAMKEFRLPNPGSEPDAIVRGPDGSMWFTEWSHRIGRVQTRPPYRIDEFETPTSTVVHKLVVDPDGRLWFTEPFADKIGRVVVRRGHAPVITEFAMTPNSGPAGLAIGRDGTIWFTEAFAGRIGRFDPARPQRRSEYALPSGSRVPLDITIAPDGTAWFTLVFSNAIGHLRIRRKIEFGQCPVPNSPYFIAAGPDGNLWFTEFHNPGIKVGRLRP